MTERKAFFPGWKDVKFKPSAHNLCNDIYQTSFQLIAGVKYSNNADIFDLNFVQSSVKRFYVFGGVLSNLLHFEWIIIINIKCK